MDGPQAVRIGVIGCGAIARLAHLPVLGAISGVRVVAIADPDPDARAAAARLAPAAQLHADHRSLLARADIDAVVIALPTAMHAAVTLDAIERGVHIYLEKPLASTLDEARAIGVAACHATRAVHALGFNYRFNPLVARARARIAAGAVGDVIAMQTVFSTTSRGMPAWKQLRGSGGGALLDLGSHHIDLARWLLDDEVATVSATLRSREGQDDCAMLRIGFSRGAVVQSLFSLASVEEDRIAVFGTAGRLIVDRYGTLGVEVDPPLVSARRMARIGRLIRAPQRLGFALARRRSAAHEPSYRIALQDFVAAIGGAGHSGASFMDGERAAAVVDAAERSANSGATISLAATDTQCKPTPAAAPRGTRAEAITSA